MTILGIIAMSNNLELDWLDMKVFALFNDDFVFGNANESGNFRFIETNVTLTLIGVLFIVGGMMVGFSKEKREDEFIANLRLSSLLWSVWVSYILLFLAFIFVYGMSFFNVMVYNMFTVLIIFIIRFNYILWRNSKSLADDK
jgi:hypothetical protein